MRIALFGAPGVGKGSQAALLSRNQGLEHISTGVILRQAIRSDSPVGRSARSFVETGQLVPGVIVRALAEDAIAARNYEDFVLDGYPRTIEQAEWLTDFLEEHQRPLHAVVSLCVSDDVIVNRLSRRRVNIATGENYHLDFKPPPPGVDPALIVQREDDRPDAIMKRLQVYRDQTFPVEDYYRQSGQLVDVDGLGSFEEVHDRIVTAVQRMAAPA